MPKTLEGSITHLDELPEEDCKHIPLNYFWPINSQDTSLTVSINCLKWTSNYEFCVRVTAYPLGTPNISKQIDLDDHHPLLRSLTDALNLYEAFPEPHLNSHQFENLQELMEYLHFKFQKKINCHKTLTSFHQIGMILKKNANMFHWLVRGPALVKTEH